MTERMTDAQLDREIAAFLDWESGSLAGAPTAGEVAVRVREHVRPGVRVPVFGVRRPRLGLVLLGAILALLATAAIIGGSRPHLPISVRNGWIAFSSQPGYRQAFTTDRTAGGDIYLVREGVAPRVLVERGPDMKRNVCPRFSMDGSLLAYGELAGNAATLVVLALNDDGAVTASRRFAVPGPSTVAPCPRWSRNGTHVAYLEGVRWDDEGQLVDPGTGVVVVGLDGAAAPWTAEDPSIDELRRSGTFDPLDAPDGPDPLLSPDGRLRATCRDGMGLVVGPADGSADRRVADCGYSIAAWSPDGARILLLSDSGLGVGLTVVPVAGPPPMTSIGYVPINGARSFPGRGDASWQPVHP